MAELTLVSPIMTETTPLPKPASAEGWDELIRHLEDNRQGLVPLPKKPEPQRTIPPFPDSTYRFLKRLD